MSMPNREVAALERHARAQAELATAIKSEAGKEYQKQRELLEKAAGGKRKLVQAEKVLDEAKAEADKLLADARAKTVALLSGADKEINVARAALDEQERALKGMQVRLTKREETLSTKAAEVDAAEQAGKERETAADARESDLNRRESEVTSREARATAREADIARYDAWRAAAPA